VADEWVEKFNDLLLQKDKVINALEADFARD